MKKYNNPNNNLNININQKSIPQIISEDEKLEAIGIFNSGKIEDIRIKLLGTPKLYITDDNGNNGIHLTLLINDFILRETEKLQIIQLLIDNHVSHDVGNKMNVFPIHMVVQKRYSSIFDFFMKLDINNGIHIEDYYGNNILHYSVNVESEECRIDEPSKSVFEKQEKQNPTYVETHINNVYQDIKNKIENDIIVSHIKNVIKYCTLIQPSYYEEKQKMIKNVNNINYYGENLSILAINNQIKENIQTSFTKLIEIGKTNILPGFADFSLYDIQNNTISKDNTVIDFKQVDQTMQLLLPELYKTTITNIRTQFTNLQTLVNKLDSLCDQFDKHVEQILILLVNYIQRVELLYEKTLQTNDIIKDMKNDNIHLRNVFKLFLIRNKEKKQVWYVNKNVYMNEFLNQVLSIDQLNKINLDMVLKNNNIKIPLQSVTFVDFQTIFRGYYLRTFGIRYYINDLKNKMTKIDNHITQFEMINTPFITIPYRLSFYQIAVIYMFNDYKFLQDELNQLYDKMLLYIKLDQIIESFRIQHQRFENKLNIIIDHIYPDDHQVAPGYNIIAYYLYILKNQIIIASSRKDFANIQYPNSCIYPSIINNNTIEIGYVFNNFANIQIDLTKPFENIQTIYPQKQFSDELKKYTTDLQYIILYHIYTRIFKKPNQEFYDYECLHDIFIDIQLFLQQNKGKDKIDNTEIQSLIVFLLNDMFNVTTSKRLISNYSLYYSEPIFNEIKNKITDIDSIRKKINDSTEFQKIFDSMGKELNEFVKNYNIKQSKIVMHKHITFLNDQTIPVIIPEILSHPIKQIRVPNVNEIVIPESMENYHHIQKQLFKKYLYSIDERHQLICYKDVSIEQSNQFGGMNYTPKKVSNGLLLLHNNFFDTIGIVGVSTVYDKQLIETVYKYAGEYLFYLKLLILNNQLKYMRQLYENNKDLKKLKINSDLFHAKLLFQLLNKLFLETLENVILNDIKNELNRNGMNKLNFLKSNEIINSLDEIKITMDNKSIIDSNLLTLIEDISKEDIKDVYQIFDQPVNKDSNIYHSNIFNKCFPNNRYIIRKIIKMYPMLVAKHNTNNQSAFDICVRMFHIPHIEELIQHVFKSNIDSGLRMVQNEYTTFVNNFVHHNILDLQNTICVSYRDHLKQLQTEKQTTFNVQSIFADFIVNYNIWFFQQLYKSNRALYDEYMNIYSNNDSHSHIQFQSDQNNSIIDFITKYNKTYDKTKMNDIKNTKLSDKLSSMNIYYDQFDKNVSFMHVHLYLLKQLLENRQNMSLINRITFYLVKYIRDFESTQTILFDLFKDRMTYFFSKQFMDILLRKIIRVFIVYEYGNKNNKEKIINLIKDFSSREKKMHKIIENIIKYQLDIYSVHDIDRTIYNRAYVTQKIEEHFILVPQIRSFASLISANNINELLNEIKTTIVPNCIEVIEHTIKDCFELVKKYNNMIVKHQEINQLYHLLLKHSSGTGANS
jgi:hypothetical protein